MKYVKRIIALMLSVLFLAASTMQSFAADGTEVDPDVGGYDFGTTTDANAIHMYKYDISAFVEAKSLLVGESITYVGNSATGAELTSTDVVGYYYPTAAGDLGTNRVDVTLGELTSMSAVTFRIESVELKTGSTAGSTTTTDYVATGTIDRYASTSATGQIDWTGLPSGYYKISEVAGDSYQAFDKESFIVSLPMVDPTDSTQTVNEVYIYPKNATGPGASKEIAEISGNTIDWKITATVPSNLQATMGVQVYKVTDTMSPADALSLVTSSLSAYYNDGTTDIPLTMEEKTVTATVASSAMDFIWSYDSTTGTITFELTAAGFTNLGSVLSSIDESKIYFEYSTTVSLTDEQLGQLATDPITNEVQLNFTDSDGTEYENGGTPVTEDDLAGLKIQKIDGNDSTQRLNGAQFEIYQKAADGSYVALKDKDGNNVVLTTADVVDSITGLVTESGVATYYGLTDGTYYLKEIAAPTGYELYEGYVEVTISTTNAEDNEVVAVDVKNYFDTGFNLPLTGGAGTVMFMLIGAALIVLAVVVFKVSRKRSVNN